MALARALARPHARLILLDEPFSALDTALRVRLRRELMVLQQEIDATTILVTHDPDDAMLLADELLLLEDGHVLQSGPAAAVFLRPAGQAAARLLGAETIGQGRVVAPDGIDLGGVVLPVGGPALSAGTAVGWAVRSHQVRLGQAGNGPLAAWVLSRRSMNDGQAQVRLRLGNVVVDVVTDRDGPSAGPCSATIPPDVVQVWPL